MKIMQKEEILGIIAGNVLVAFVMALVNPEIGFWGVLWTLIQIQFGLF